MKRISKQSGFEIEVDDGSFEEEVVERSKKIPVVVDFWAEWCAPCRILKPILGKIVREYKEKFILVKINIEEYPRKAEEFNVMSIPSVKFFKNGKVVDEFTGVMPEDSIKRWLDKNL